MMNRAQIMATIQTRRDVEAVVREIEQLSTAAFADTPDRWGEVLREKVAPARAVVFGGLEASGRAQALRDLEKELEGIEYLELTVAFDVPEGVLARICAKVKELFGPMTVCDLVFDRGIMGGAKISYHGYYQDLSLTKKVDEWFEKQIKD